MGTGLILQNNLGDDLTLGAAIPGLPNFAFSKRVADGESYSVTVRTQPTSPAQTCTVANGSGVVTQDITNVYVSCGAAKYPVNVNVTGLSGIGKLVLQNNGGDDLALTASGSYPFATPFDSGAEYRVTVLEQPATPSAFPHRMGRCTIASPTGTIAAAPVTVDVTCLESFYEGFDDPAGPPVGWSISTPVPVSPAPADPWTWSQLLGAGEADTSEYAFRARGSDSHAVNTTLTSPPISVVNTNAKVSFRHRFDTEIEWDGGVLQIEIGTGAGFVDAGTCCTFVTGGYERTILSSANSTVLAGKPAWTGKSAGYITTTVNLPVSAASKDIRLRWMWANDPLTLGAWGWSIDTIQVDR